MSPGRTTREPANRLAILSERLVATDFALELYSVGGAVMWQGFAAAPSSARISQQFAPYSEVKAFLDELASVEGFERGWLQTSVAEWLAREPGGGSFLDLPRLRVLSPPAELALAVKCAALGHGSDREDVDDVRLLVRVLNLSDAATALSVVTRYVPERHLAPAARELLESLFAA